MAKLGGILQVFNELEYLKPCLEQSLKHYDELVVFEGGHCNKFPPRSTDGTIEYLEKKGVPFQMVHPHEGQKYDSVQCSYLAMGIAMLKKRECDWFRFIDCDMIWHDEDLRAILGTMDTAEEDCITFNERRFIFNWKINTHAVQGYFYRMVPGLFLSPISRVHYGDGRLIRDCSTHQMGSTCFHFTSAKKLERMKFRFEISAEKGTPDIPEMWARYCKYDVNGELDKEEIEALVGGFGANIYSGEYPEVLDGHPYRFCNDIRTVE